MEACDARHEAQLGVYQWAACDCLHWLAQDEEPLPLRFLILLGDLRQALRQQGIYLGEEV